MAAVESSINPALLESLAENHVKLTAIEEEHLKSVDALMIPHRRAQAKLYAERQPHLDKMEGLWTAAITAADSPLKELMIQIDTKLCRAITQLRMDLEEPEGGTQATKLVITFRDNMFVHGGEVSLTIDRDRKIVASTGIKWKVPEKMREGSVFAVFAGAESGLTSEFIYEVFTGFEQIFADPIVFANGDE